MDQAMEYITQNLRRLDDLMKINIYGKTMTALAELMVKEGQKPYRAKQLFKWIYEKGATTFDEMSDVSLKFREVLNEKYCLEKPKVFIRQDATD